MTNLHTLQPIVITAGEPAGIGPDIIIQLLSQWFSQGSSKNLDIAANTVIIGNKQAFQDRAKVLNISLDIIDYSTQSAPEIMDRPTLRMINVPCDGKVTARATNKANAQHLLTMLDRAIDGCLSGEFSAMVTAPINKQVINDAGIAFTGHTEYLAERTQTEQVVMLLASNELRVTLATTHIPLSRVATSLTQEGLVKVLSITNNDLINKFGIENPVIHVCGLNPHAGEGGHLGTEEITIIEPAIVQAQALGIDARGPFSADTAFSVSPKPDAFLAMFHDQGLPVLKYASFGHAVNITLGLPIIRTSVDHGTALALAGTGEADTGSLQAAIDSALHMIEAQRKTHTKTHTQIEGQH